MKKRILMLICFVLVIATSFAGCTLFERNIDVYLSKTVATVDDDIEITKEDLINAYYNYGYQYVQQYSYTVEQAVDATIELLVNREVMLRQAKKEFTLSEKEKSKLWWDTYDAMNSNLETYEEEVIKDWEISTGTVADKTATEEGEEENTGVYTPFAKKAEVVFENGQYVVKALSTEKDELADVEIIAGGADKFENYRSKKVVGLSDAQSKRVSDEAYRRYIKALKKNEEGRVFNGENAYTDAKVLERAVQKTYDSYEEAYFVEKLQDKISADTNVSAEDVLKKYKELVLEDYVKYTNDTETFKTDILTVGTPAEMYYIPTEGQDEYFFVSHFLLKFTTEQQELVDDLKVQLKENAISKVQYESELANVYAQIGGEKFIDGEASGETYTANEILTMLNNELVGKSEEEKAKIFNKYIYYYNQDTSFNNSETGYVIGMENSQMVENFNEVSRSLYNTAKATYDLDGNELTAEKHCLLSGLVESDYGIHIIMYLNKVETVIPVANADNYNLSNSDLWTLYNASLYRCSNKTVFDKVYDAVYTDKSSINESLYLNSLRKNVDLKIYKNSYKDLLG